MISSKNTSSIIIHVTPNYQLDIPANTNISRYTISPVEISNTIDDDDDINMNRRYTLNDVNTEIIGDGYDFLNTKKTLDQSQKMFITSLKKQMMRLRYCVLGLPYTLSLRYSDYLSFMDPSDTSSIVFYRTHNIQSSETRRLYLVCTISTFFSKAPLIDSECSTIIDGIMNVLETNQHLHIRNIKKMLEEQTHYIQTRDMEKTQHKQRDYITQYTTLLHELIDCEREKNLELQTCDVSLKSDFYDINTSRLKDRIIQDLNDIKQNKKQTIKAIRELKSMYEDTSLVMDSVLYDTSMMLSKVQSNLKVIQNSMTNKHK